mmetsp:Transcript_87106/g.243069  ORF Transcript_87106/g.243069 Transcript_87106/m.243069 type:complete len:159 (+) Transcript_87106:3022-3498(+)
MIAAAVARWSVVHRLTPRCVDHGDTSLLDVPCMSLGNGETPDGAVLDRPDRGDHRLLVPGESRGSPPDISCTQPLVASSITRSIAQLSSPSDAALGLLAFGRLAPRGSGWGENAISSSQNCVCGRWAPIVLSSRNRSPEARLGRAGTCGPHVHQSFTE